MKFDALARRYGGMRLFITSSGYLGLCPKSTRLGDEVWVLPRLGVPMMLRDKPSID